MVGFKGKTPAISAGAWFASRADRGPIGLVRRGLTNVLSLRLLRQSQRRTAGLRLFIGIVLVGFWLVFGVWAALNSASPVPSASVGAIESATDFVCAVQKGKVCDVNLIGDREPLARISQTALTFFTVVTLLFSFWSQLLGAVAHTLRNLGEGHVLIIGDGADAEALARDVARRGRPGRKLAVLVRESAPDAEAEALAADGVVLLAGPPADAALLQRAGVRTADHVVAISASDAQNVAVAAMAAQLRQDRGRADVLLRLEDDALRTDLAGHQAFNGVRFFSLPDIATRRTFRSTALFDRARRLRHERVHIVAAGDDVHLFAIALKTFRLQWARGFEAPRVSLFTRDRARTEQSWRQLFPCATGNDTWSADISFHALPTSAGGDAWDSFMTTLNTEGRGPACAMFVAFEDETVNLRLAASLSRDAVADATPLIFARENAHGSLGIALAGSHETPVSPFGAPQDVATASALIDQSLDKAARHIHEVYLETCILSQDQACYRTALRRSVAFLGIMAVGADADSGASTSSLEMRVTQKHGAAGLARLRRDVCLDILRRNAFAPNANAGAQAPWDGLPETFVTRNRNAADHAIAKLWSLGWTPAVRGGQKPVISSEELSRTDCDLEHRRWAADLLLDGWRFGERSDRQLRHPDLKPYGAFSSETIEAAVKKDLDQWVAAVESGMIMCPEGFVRTGARA